jgi:hypothetical protein
VEILTKDVVMIWTRFVAFYAAVSPFSQILLLITITGTIMAIIMAGTIMVIANGKMWEL